MPTNGTQSSWKAILSSASINRNIWSHCNLIWRWFSDRPNGSISNLQNPATSSLKIICAVPVASKGAIAAIDLLVDSIVFSQIPSKFQRIGEFYRNFGKVNNEEVMHLHSQPPQAAVRSFELRWFEKIVAPDLELRPSRHLGRQVSQDEANYLVDFASPLSD